MQNKKKYFTVMFIPEGNAKPFSLHIHRNIVYSLATFLFVFIIGFVLLVVKSGEIATKLQLVYMLSSENKQLKEENKTIKIIANKMDKIDQMSEYLERIALTTGTDTKKGLLALSKAPNSNPVLSVDTVNAVLDSLQNAADADPKNAVKKAELSERYNMSIPTIQPVIDGWITSRYSTISNDTVQPHTGIDFAATTGTLIRATAPGTVSSVVNDRYFGLTVNIKHDFGFETRYGHCSQILVSKGDHVVRGQTIALVGNTGHSSAPHLHYEILKDNKNVDPSQYLLGTFSH